MSRFQRFLLDDVKSIVEASDDIEMQAIYYSALAEMETASKNYKAAFLNQKLYISCVDSVYRLQRKIHWPKRSKSIII